MTSSTRYGAPSPAVRTTAAAARKTARLLTTACAGAFLALSAMAAPRPNLCPDITEWETCNRPAWTLVHEDGKPALHLSLRGPAERTTAIKGLFPTLKPDTNYVVSVRMRCEGLRNGIAQYGVDFYKGGKHYPVGGYPNTGISDTRGWKEIRHTFTSPATPGVQGELLVYVTKGVSGDLWFTAPRLTEGDPTCFADIIKPVARYALQPGKREIIVSSRAVGVVADSATLKFFRNGTLEFTRQAQVIDDRIRTTVDLKPGTYRVDIEISAGDRSFASSSNLTVLPPGLEPPAHAVMLDEKGRCIRDGRKFMPIGMYVSIRGNIPFSPESPTREQDFKNFKNSPFNCIMPYSAPSWRNRDGKNTIEAIRKNLDSLEENGIGILFNLKDLALKKDTSSRDRIAELVSALKDHPAVIAWYMKDETAVDSIDREIRQLVSTIDPFHPTWQVQCSCARLHRFAGGADVFGFDPYPLKSTKHDTQRHVEICMDQAYKAFGFDGVHAFWGVPQAFAWGDYKNADKAHYYPTEKDMRSMGLLMAIKGSTGFIYYTYNTIYMEKGKGRWPEICRAVQPIKDLEKYLLSDAQPPALTVRTTSGEVRARAFRDEEGKTAVVIASIGPGKAEAEITIGVAGLKARFGNTRDLGAGTYRFTGTDIDSDILSE